jgi:transposase
VKHSRQADALASRIVPDELWRVVQTLLPPAKVRPQGGGRPRVDDRAVFAGVVFVLTSGSSWRQLPVSFGVAAPTAYRRFMEWSQSGLFARLPAAARLADAGGELLGWVDAIAVAASERSDPP